VFHTHVFALTERIVMCWDTGNFSRTSS